MKSNYFIWPNIQNYKFLFSSNAPNKKKIHHIEDFFKKKYNAKYCVLVPSARSAIIQSLNFKKFDKSKIIQIPLWSSSCLYETLGSKVGISCTNTNADINLLVHHFGLTHKTIGKKKNIIEDSSDSLPTKNFIANKKSNFLEVISLPKIISSFSGGLAFTRNNSLYKFLKKNQSLNPELSNNQSYKKYKSLVKMNGNFEWHINESKNFGLDHNLVENVAQCLDNFQKNLGILKKRFKIYQDFNFFNEKFRIGPCLIINLKTKKINSLRKYHINIIKTFGKNKYKEFTVLPIHFSVKEDWIEKKINEIRKI